MGWSVMTTHPELTALSAPKLQLKTQSTRARLASGPEADVPRPVRSQLPVSGRIQLAEAAAAGRLEQFVV